MLGGPPGHWMGGGLFNAISAVTVQRRRRMPGTRLTNRSSKLFAARAEVSAADFSAPGTHLISSLALTLCHESVTVSPDIIPLSHVHQLQ